MASVDCEDRVCYLTHRIVDRCTFYIAKNNSACNIPCDLTDCLKQIKLNYYCSIWHCEKKFTTTTTTTTTATTTMSPDSSTVQPPTPDFNLLTIISLSGNVFLCILIISMLFCLKPKIVQLFRRTRTRTRLNNSDQSPTENIPLRSARFQPSWSNQEQSQRRAIIPDENFFSIASSNESSSRNSNITGFSTVDLNDEPRFLVNPDSIEAATDDSGAAILNISEQSVSFKKPRKKMFSKKFWRSRHHS